MIVHGGGIVAPIIGINIGHLQLHVICTKLLFDVTTNYRIGKWYDSMFLQCIWFRLQQGKNVKVSKFNN